MIFAVCALCSTLFNLSTFPLSFTSLLVWMERKVANAVGGKTARPCEDCRKRRARWYCAADDAFLCRSCDSIIHSANTLAERHERVRLKSSSSPSSSSSSAKKPLKGDLLPSWHKSFTRKARSVRPHKQVKASKAEESTEAAASLAANTFLVPEIGDDEIQEENEAQLLYRVPVFDPIDVEFHVSRSMEATVASSSLGVEQKPASGTLTDSDHDMDTNCKFDHFASFFPSDMDLAEFAADVESLLGRGFGDESFCMEGLGLQDSREPHELDLFNGRVKKEEEEDEPQERASSLVEAHLAIPKDSFELNFDYDTPTTADEEEEKVLVTENPAQESSHGGFAKRICLRLNYEAVITAWAGQGAPWTTGSRPQINPADCWPDCMGMNGTVMNSTDDPASLGMHGAIADGGREARVSRYREKRRTRLFSKKIRYEVRKLNAEKRPRMKGRFVKRTPSFPAATAFAYG